MSVINSNMAALVATNAIVANDRDQERAMERLSTGLRINSAADDAAGLAISERMAAEVSGLNMATRNSNDAISMLSTVEGASAEVITIFQRMRELAVQSASDTYARTDRLAMDLEFGQLMGEIERIANNTTWNTMSLLNGGNNLLTSAVTQTTATIQLGKAANETMALTLKSWNPRGAIELTHQNERINAAGTVTNVYAAGAGNGNDNWRTAVGGTIALETSTAFGSAVLWTGGDDGALAGVDAAGPPLVLNNEAVAGDASSTGRINIETRTNSGFALTQLDIAITAATSERALLGAYINRLEHAGNNLTNVSRFQEQSRSRIADADYAIETSELSRTTIIAQASTAMLAQANAAKQTVLTLLQ
jgi:flagellin